MARRPTLSLTALLGVLVLGLHLAMLDWLAQTLPTASVLKPVSQAMFTREIVPTTAPPPSSIQKTKVKKPFRHTPSNFLATTSIAITSTYTVTPDDAEDAKASPDASTAAQTSPTATVSATDNTPTAVLVPADETPPSNEWPGNTRLSYGLTGFYRGAVKGDARVQWQKEQDRYQVVVDIDLGLISTRMTSQGLMGKDRLEPKAYEEKTGPNLRTLLLEPNRIRLMGGEWVARPPDVQDTASQFVDLAQRFSQQPALLAVGKAVPVWLARPGGVDEWTYDVVALENLNSEHLGTVPAYHLKPRPLAKPRGPVSAEIWFAPSLQYLPVRIRLSIGADAWLDLMVEKVEQQ